MTAKKASPTHLTLKLLRKQDWTAQVVEHWNPHARVRVDLFGCIDLVALKGGHALGIQACITGMIPKRLDKALSQRGLRAWLRAGLLFEVWGWSKMGGRGERKLWTVQRQPVLGWGAGVPAIPHTLVRDAYMPDWVD